MNNEEEFSKEMNIIVDAEPIVDNLLKAFKIKIKNLNNDPGNDHWHSYFAIIYQNKIIGAIGSKGKPSNESCIEVGYGISESYRNLGIATEALKLFINHFFKEYSIKSIVAETEKENFASQKVLEKNCFNKIQENETILWKIESFS
ncbi:MAG: GNAT family N-acetyltransferase [Paludibacter sp.]